MTTEKRVFIHVLMKPDLKKRFKQKLGITPMSPKVNELIEKWVASEN